MIDTAHSSAPVPVPLPTHLPPPAPRQQPRPPPRRAPPPEERVRLPNRDLPDSHDEIAPIDVWWGLEDLWLRLQRAGRLRSEETDTPVFPSFRHRAIGDELSQAVVEVERYDWRVGVARGSFVRELHYLGEDLRCLLTPPIVVARWPEGQTLVQLRAALLLRLRSPE